jgi:hypothetical protein
MMKSSKIIATNLDSIFKNFLIRFKVITLEPKLTIIVPNFH